LKSINYASRCESDLNAHACLDSGLPYVFYDDAPAALPALLEAFPAVPAFLEPLVSAAGFVERAPASVQFYLGAVGLQGSVAL
jgi:hypothetical protein